MAVRPVFSVGDQYRAAYRRDVEFKWFAGMSDAQRRRSIDSLHEAYLTRYPEGKVLEISSKSRQELGVKLSAFNLTKFVPSLGKSIPVECVYQGSKVLTKGGPYTDLYEALPIDAKRDPRLKENGVVKGFFFEGKEYPIWPVTAFYDWVWCNALLEHPEMAEEIVRYDAFTDIVFNPEKSQNCQAHAAAVFVSLARRGLLDRMADFDAFVRLL